MASPVRPLASSGGFPQPLARADFGYPSKEVLADRATAGVPASLPVRNPTVETQAAADAAEAAALLTLLATPGRGDDKKDDSFWRELRHDIRDYILHFDHERIDDFSRMAKSLGSGLRTAWKLVRDIPAKILDHPIIVDNVDKEDRDFWAELGGKVGLVAGLAAAGGHALAGVVKLGSAIKNGHLSRGLDGLVDIASGTSLALAVAGLAGAKAIVGPIAATLNLVRGVYNAATGFKRGDERKQLQGTLDVTRSAGSFGRLMKRHGAAFGVMGIAFAPIAGTLQAGRGMHDLATGLKNDDNKKELRGLVDIATAVGTAMAFASGVAVIPGVALAVAANLVKVGYQLSPRLRKRIDKVIDKNEPRLQKMVDKSEDLSVPVVRGWKKFMGRLIKNIDATAPERFTKAQLAEITNLVHADGRYSRNEYDRLRTVLETAGQKKDLPKRDAQPPETLRPELIGELAKPEQRVGFVRFLLVVADYDYQATPVEIGYLRHLATSDLGIPAEEFQRLVDERAARLAQQRERALLQQHPQLAV